VVKVTVEDKPFAVVIHICMKRTERISLYICLYLKIERMTCFLFYLLCFLFYKIGEQEVEQVLPGRVNGTEWGSRE
jgi:hypothetical protein